MSPYAYSANNPYIYVDSGGQFWGLAAKVVKIAIKGGDIASTVAGIADDYSTLTDSTASPAARAFAAASLISEVASPISLKDAKAAKRMMASSDNIADGAKKAMHADVSQTSKAVQSSVTKGASKKADDVIHVTKDGVALPPGKKYEIPDNYVQNPNRDGNYGEIVNGKYKERLRIDPATPKGKKGPNYSHYHKDGKGAHLSPKSGDKDPGF